MGTEQNKYVLIFLRPEFFRQFSFKWRQSSKSFIKIESKFIQFDSKSKQALGITAVA